MSSPTILLITGGNTGLGLETARSLLLRSIRHYRILLGGRSFDKATAAADALRAELGQKQGSGASSESEVVPVQIDLEDDASIAALKERVEKEFGRLDVLVNNGGGQFDQQLYHGNLGMREMWNKSWDVNVTGTYILTHTLIPLLLKSSDPRILFITSGTATLTESTNLAVPVNKSPGVKGWPKDTQSFIGMGIPAYRASKTGLNMMVREWVRLLKDDGVKCWAVSPGMLATGLGMGDPEFLKKLGALDPSVGADFVRSVVEGERDADVGLAVRKAGVQPW